MNSPHFSSLRLCVSNFHNRSIVRIKFLGMMVYENVFSYWLHVLRVVMIKFSSTP